MVLNIYEKIKKLKKHLNYTLNMTDDKQRIRNRKLNFSDIFYFINLYNSNYNTTYDKIYNTVISDDTYSEISKNAFIKKRNDLPIEHFENINNKLINYIYNDLSLNNKPRYLSIDASNLHFLSKLNDDFKPNKHNTYTNGCLSCLFDINLQIPINYNLSKSFNERELLIEQFKYIKPNDILIADRGYYSDALINKFIDNKFNFIFRLKSSELKIKEFNKFESEFNNDVNHYIIDHNYNGQIYKFKIIKYQTYYNKEVEKENLIELRKKIITIKNIIINIEKNISLLRDEKINLIHHNKILKSIIKNKIGIKQKLFLDVSRKNNIIKKKITNDIKNLYIEIDSHLKTCNLLKEKIKLIEKVNNSVYYIMTNKINLSNDDIKSLYKKRWCIETHFRFAKDKFKMRSMESKSKNIILQNILATQFIFLLEGYIEHLMTDELNKNKKFNRSSFIDIMHKYLIKHILISKNSKKTIKLINKILLNLLKSTTKIRTELISNPRIKKRPGSKWINIQNTS